MTVLMRSAGSSRTDVPMAPMIDIVFQLLIFFMLNMKIIAPEGNFNVNMPRGFIGSDGVIPDIKVRLQSDVAGNLVQLSLGDNALGNDDRAFEKLSQEMLNKFGRPGAALSDDVEVEIDADYDLRYEYIIKAVSKCTGKIDAKGNVTRFVEKIKFAPPHKREG